MSGTITFPPNPTDGQLYTAGGVTWQWHANPGVWVNANTGTNFLALSGGTMTGAITLPGNATQPLQATPLQQVVPIAGGTMTGALTLSGNAATALQATPLQQVNATVAPAFNDVGRNVLNNATFLVAQRGVGPFVTNAGAFAYTADRWLASTAGGAAGDNLQTTLAAASDTNRSQIGDEAAQTLLSATFTGGGTGSTISMIQRIENVRRLANRTVTLSFYANAGTALNLGATLAQVFGAGGSPSPTVQLTPQTVTLLAAAAFARYSMTFTMPSVAGKTFGTTAGSDYTQLAFYYSAQGTPSIGNQSGTINLWGVQLEVGSVATPLDYGGSPQQQLADCQRFYQTGTLVNAAYQVAGQTVGAASILLVQMRTAPSVSTAGTPSDSNVGSLGFGSNPQMVQLTGTATGTGSWIIAHSFAATADL